MDPDYELFAKVVEAGSLTAAAKGMAISPATASKRLARLEQRLGVRLIHRTTRQLVLTATGKRFHADLTGILAALRDAENRITGDVAVPTGQLRISAPTSFGRLHIAPRLPQFLEENPRVDLQLDLTDAFVNLFEGNFDLAIRIAASVPTSLKAHRLCGNRRILCASPSYLDRYGTPASLAALRRHRLLAAKGQLPWRLSKGGKQCIVEGESCVLTNSSEVVRELAISGVGVALRSLWDVDQLLASGLLVPILPDWGVSSDLAIHAVHPRSPVVPLAVTAFTDFLRGCFDPPPWEQTFG